MFSDLRKESTNILNEIEFDGYALGGLSVGENHEEMIHVVKETTQYMVKKKPRYVMGVGRPIDIFNSVENGIDMFDCVLPTRFGRNGEHLRMRVKLICVMLNMLMIKVYLTRQLIVMHQLTFQNLIFII